MSDKFVGRCAYCGCELTKGWHIDELEPIRRKRNGIVKSVNGCMMVPANTPKGFILTTRCLNLRQLQRQQTRDVAEGFRRLMGGFLTFLNWYSVRYQIAKGTALLKK